MAPLLELIFVLFSLVISFADFSSWKVLLTVIDGHGLDDYFFLIALALFRKTYDDYLSKEIIAIIINLHFG